MSRDSPAGDAVNEQVLGRISDGVLAIDAEGRVTYLNESAETFLEDGRLGESLWETLAASGRDVLRPTVERARATGEVQSCEWTDREQICLARVYPDETGLTVLLSQTTERCHYDATLGRLLEATRQMLLAETPDRIAELISRAAVEILELPVNAVHLYDEDSDGLIPATQSEGCYDILGTPPTLTSGLAWDAYQSGSVALYPDLRSEMNVYDAETPFRSELMVPIGEYGVLIVSSERADDFSETDVTLAKLLGSNATIALDKVTTESRVAQQRDNLELLTRMMSHDIRNDLQVIGAVADILAENLESGHQEYVEKISRNTAAAVDLTTSAQELVEAMLRTDSDPCPVPLRSSLQSQIDRVTETKAETPISVDGAIPDVTVVADEMLESVFRNVLKNAIEHNDADVPSVAVTVDTDDDTVRVRIADNGPGVPDERKEEIFGRGERGMSSHGTGIGLYLVQTLVEQYGGRVWVEDNEPRGAVFVVELRRN